MQWEISRGEEVNNSRGSAEERLETKSNGGAGKMARQVRVMLCKCET